MINSDKHYMDIFDISLNVSKSLEPINNKDLQVFMQLSVFEYISQYAFSVEEEVLSVLKKCSENYMSFDRLEKEWKPFLEKRLKSFVLEKYDDQTITSSDVKNVIAVWDLGKGFKPKQDSFGRMAKLSEFLINSKEFYKEFFDHFVDVFSLFSDELHQKTRAVYDAEMEKNLSVSFPLASIKKTQ